MIDMEREDWLMVGFIVVLMLGMLLGAGVI